MYEQYIQDFEPFTRSDRFVDDMETMVRRFSLIHWSMEKLAHAEFYMNDSNEWLWNFAELCFRSVIADAERASDMAAAIQSPNRPRQIERDYLLRRELLRIAEELQEDGLKAQGLSYPEIQARLAATASIICRELDAALPRAREREVS